MPVDITGKYQLSYTDKFEEYMKAVGVGMILRKMAATATPIAEIKKTGPDEYFIRQTTTFKTTDLKFRLGETFTEETADGRVCQAKITFETENKMRHEQDCDGMKLVMWREFTPTEMKMVLEGPGVTSTRIYKKIE